MRLTVDGDVFDLDPETVVDRLRGCDPHEVRTHWVEVTGVRFPVKQALEVVLRTSRDRFTSHRALDVFARLGFVTSTKPESVVAAGARRPSARPEQHEPVAVEQAAEAFATLVGFLRQKPITTATAELENRLLGAEGATVAQIVAEAGLTEELLRAALIVRRDVGRVSDVIHASVITLALPHILEDGERIMNRPSLGPGNDPSRQFDLETDRRVAEFKAALWSGGDMMRKRGVVADLVHLAMDDSGRRPELWIAGTQPARFLQTSASPVRNLLSRSSRHLRSRFEARYGSDDIPLRQFSAEHAGHVRIRDIATVVPAISGVLAT